MARSHFILTYPFENRFYNFKHFTIMSNNGRVFLGIVTAAAAGAVIGLLFAPEKGDDLRRKVKDSVNDWADQLLDSNKYRQKTKLINLKNKLSFEGNMMLKMKFQIKSNMNLNLKLKMN